MKIPENKIEYFETLRISAKSKIEANIAVIKQAMSRYNNEKKIAESSQAPKIAIPLAYELIEAQVSTKIPVPRIEPERFCLGRQRNARTLEHVISDIYRRVGMEKRNDIDERQCYICGSSVWLVEWDESIKTHGEVGGFVFTNVELENFIPQPGCAEIQDMEYCFIEQASTVWEAARKYDIDIEKLRYDADLRVGDDTDSTENGRTDSDSIVIHTCFYKNDDGEICKLEYTGRIMLLDIERYYSRKRMICAECGRRKELSGASEKCGCGGEFITVDDDYEELTHDLVLEAGGDGKKRRIIPALSPVIRNGRPMSKVVYKPSGADGAPAIENVNGQMLPKMAAEREIVMQPTRIKWYRPKLFPIFVRKNTSKREGIYGQSDVDIISDICDEYNKVSSRISEKMMGAGCYPYKPENSSFLFDNTINQTVLNISREDNRNLYGVLDTTPNISQDIAYLQFLREQAQRALGITNSFLGQGDSSAKSGKAKQVQVTQSAGRLESKRVMKDAGFCELNRIIFENLLAYADEPREVKYTDEFGQVHNSAFNRYDYLEYDHKTGEWYYDDLYSFAIDDAANLEERTSEVWETIFKSYQMGLYGQVGTPDANLRVWQYLTRAHFPFAAEETAKWQDQISRARMMQNGASATGVLGDGRELQRGGYQAGVDAIRKLGAQNAAVSPQSRQKRLVDALRGIKNTSSKEKA